MSLYNEVYAELECLRCGVRSRMLIFINFGFLGNFDTYEVGDRMKWSPSPSIARGGRFPDGCGIGEGSASCPACDEMFLVDVEVLKDVIASVRPRTDQLQNR